MTIGEFIDTLKKMPKEALIVDRYGREISIQDLNPWIAVGEDGVVHAVMLQFNSGVW